MPYLFEEFLQSHFSLCNEQYILDNHLILDEVDVPEMTECQIRQHPRNAQLPHQAFPVTFFHCLRLELNDQYVDTRERLEHFLDVLVRRVCPQTHGQIIQLVQKRIK